MRWCSASGKRLVPQLVARGDEVIALTRFPTKGAKPPRHIPVWLGRLLVGEVGISLVTQVRRASNAKARRKPGWSPCYATWKQGFHTGLG